MTLKKSNISIVVKTISVKPKSLQKQKTKIQPSTKHVNYLFKEYLYSVFFSWNCTFDNFQEKFSSQPLFVALVCQDIKEMDKHQAFFPTGTILCTTIHSSNIFKNNILIFEKFCQGTVDFLMHFLPLGNIKN